MVTQAHEIREGPVERPQDAAARAFALAPGEGEARWWFGTLATIKAAAEQTRGRYALVEILAPARYEGVLHVHHNEDEGFYLVEGEVTLYVGDQTIEMQPGSFAFGPQDVPHAFRVGALPAKLLFLLSPAGLEGFIREVSEPTRSLTVPPPPEAAPTEAEMQRLAEIAARYGGEILGPTPNR